MSVTTLPAAEVSVLAQSVAADLAAEHAELEALRAEKAAMQAMTAELAVLRAEKALQEAHAARGEVYDPIQGCWVVRATRERVTTGVAFTPMTEALSKGAYRPFPAKLSVYPAGMSSRGEYGLDITSSYAAALLELIADGTLVPKLQDLAALHPQYLERRKALDDALGGRGGKKS